jgi:hypothetical protein
MSSVTMVDEDGTLKIIKYGQPQRKVAALSAGNWVIRFQRKCAMVVGEHRQAAIAALHVCHDCTSTVRQVDRLSLCCDTGGQLVLPFQGSDGLFGSNVTSRSSKLGLRAWFLAVGSPILANGTLSRFFTYANAPKLATSSSPQVMLQIWRPSTTLASTFTLVWQRPLSISATSAALYTVN